MKATLFALLALISVAVAGKVRFTDCSGLNNVKEVTVTGCSLGKCDLAIGSTVRIHATFKAVVPGKQLYSSVKGMIKGREMNFPQPRVDGCTLSDKLSPGCPLTTGKSYTYNDDFEIKNFFPPGAVEVTYAGVNENGKQVACVKVQAQFTK